MSLLLRPRQERAFERLYRRHVAHVYRYALVVLRDPRDAESVTQATFASAYRTLERGERPDEPRNWLLRTAHELCRWRSLHGDGGLADDLFEEDGRIEGPFDCGGAERAISRQLDASLRRPERKLLRAHLRSCPDCVRFAKTQRSQRAILRSFHRVPVPESLLARRRRIRIPVLARGVALAATALVVVGVAAGGVDPRRWGDDATRIQPADAAPQRARTKTAAERARVARKTEAARRRPGR
jgi:Sigma-70 region 2/Putative zinc-finger